MLAIAHTRYQHFQESLAYDVQNQGEDKEQYFGTTSHLSILSHSHTWKGSHSVKSSTNTNGKRLCSSSVVYYSGRYVRARTISCTRPKSIKMLFFGSQCERLCLLQFSLISLIPGLIGNLQDCADPQFDSYERTLTPPSSLRTSERASCMKTRHASCVF